jgi:hypothetical protein
VYYGNGAGAFLTPEIVPSLDGGLAFGDLNGGGILDLVSAPGYIAFGTTGGKFKSAVHYTVEDDENNFFNVVLADLRNNGLTDILTDNYSGVSVLLNLGNGEFEDGAWTAVTGGGGCGAAADYNGDGKPDLAVITTTGFTILLGTGKATKPFTTGTSVSGTGRRLSRHSRSES